MANQTVLTELALVVKPTVHMEELALVLGQGVLTEPVLVEEPTVHMEEPALVAAHMEDRE